MGKSRFDGTERLAFRPWQRFICIHSDVGAGDRRRPICFFSPFRCSCARCTGLVSFVRTQDEGAMCPKITIGMMLPEILKWATPWVRGMCSCFGQLQGRDAWFGDSLKADPQTPWPKAGKANTCSVPLHSLLLGFEIVVRSFHAHSFRFPRKSCSLTKKKKRHASKSKPRPISPYSLHGRDRWDIDSLPQTRWRPEAPQLISLKLGTKTNRYL